MTAKFEIVDTVGKAFLVTWEERVYLLRLALVPIIIKIVSYFFALQFVEPQDILKLALFMLPAYFVEGWMIAHWVRTLMTNHRWPFVPSGDLQQDQKEITVRSQGIMRGALAFVVINFLMAGFFAAVFAVLPPDINPEEADPTLALFSFAVMISLFFLFRFVWIYVPLSVGISLKKYMEISNPVRFTFSLIALWLVCFVPPIITMQFIGGIAMGFNGEGDPSGVIEMILVVIRVLFDTLKNLIVTAGIAFALMEVMGWKKS